MKKRSKTKFCWDLAERICDRLEQGRLLISICRDDEDVDVTAADVRKWYARNYGVRDGFARKDIPGGFAEMFRRSVEIGIHAKAEEMIEVAEDGARDWKCNARGELIVDSEAIKRSELRVKTYQWYISKMLPQVFGDKIEVTEKRDLGTYSTAEIKEMMKRTAAEAGIDLTELLDDSDSSGIGAAVH